MTCFHEPFGDAFYYGPEKISTLSQNWPADKIEKSGRAHYTYDYVLQTILDATKEPNKRVLIKDMARHIIPPTHSPNATAPSLQHHKAPNEPPNPTLLPTHHLHAFQFVFLIRNPTASIPSLYRCFLPPLNKMTELDTFNPRELGYHELRILFDYLYPPASRSSTSATNPILIDADDLLSHPHSILRSVCTRLDFPYSPSMLSWSSPEDQAHAEALFRKFAGYHEDALQSTGLHARAVEKGRKARSREEVDEEWKGKYGSEPAGRMREAVDECIADYEYLKGLRILPEEDGG